MTQQEFLDAARTPRGSLPPRPEQVALVAAYRAFAAEQSAANAEAFNQAIEAFQLVEGGLPRYAALQVAMEEAAR